MPTNIPQSNFEESSDSISESTSISPGMKKRVTLKHIAERAGIAVTSVSKALRDSNDISKETIARVKEIAEELGYHPNIIARSLVNQRTHTIGVIIPEILTTHHSFVVTGFTNTARSRGYEVILMISNECVVNESHCLRYLAGLPVDGIIATVTEETKDISLFEKTNEQGTPVLFFGRPIETDSIPSISGDDYACICELVEFLSGKGYCKFGLICPDGPLLSTKLIRSAFTEHVGKVGATFKKSWIRECQINEKSAYEATLKLLEEETDLPDSLICANDIVALGAGRAIQEKGLSIPEDIALAGSGNLIETSLLKSPITTIEFEAESMGAKAMTVLLDIIEHKRSEDAPKKITVSHKLITGGL